MSTTQERRLRELDPASEITPQSVLLVDDPAWAYARKLPKVLWSSLSDVDRGNITFVSGDDEPSAQTGKIVVYAYQDRLRAKLSDGTVVDLVTNDDTVALINVTVASERDRALAAETAMSTVPYDYGLIPAYPNPRSLADRKLDRAVPLTEFPGVTAGTGTDSAIGLQRAINWLATNRRLGLVNGPFKTSVALLLPKTDGYGLMGEGGNLAGTSGPCIAQSTADTPTLITDTAAFAGGSGYVHDLRLEGFGIGHMTAQPAANTNAVGLQIWNMVYQSSWDRLSFFNSAVGIGSKAYAPDQVNSSIIWGMHIGRLQFNGNALGCILLNTVGVGASPNNIIEHMYAVNVGAAGAYLFDLNEWSGVEINSVEINSVAGDALWVKISTSGSHVRMGHFRIENAVSLSNIETTGIKLLLNAKDVRVAAILAEGIKVANPGADLALLANFQVGGRVRVGLVRAAINSTTGLGYGLAVVGAVTADGDIEIERLDLDPMKGCLTQYDFAPSYSDRIRVLAHANGMLSPDLGDVDHQMLLDEPSVLRCSTTLTADRTWTLPNPTSLVAARYNLHAGVRRRVVRDAATPGAYALLVKDGAGTTVATLPSGQRSAVEVQWSRNAWHLLTPVQTLP